MTPRAVFFFLFLLLSASAGALHTHRFAIPTLGYSYGPIYGMDGKATVQKPRVGLRDYMGGKELQEHGNLNNAIVRIIQSIDTVTCILYLRCAIGTLRLHPTFFESCVAVETLAHITWAHLFVPGRWTAREARVFHSITSALLSPDRRTSCMELVSRVPALMRSRSSLSILNSATLSSRCVCLASINTINTR